MATDFSLYPVTLTNLSAWLTVVVGGGRVGERKVRGLLAAGAQVRVISPVITGPLQEWVEAGRIDWLARPYQPGDLTGAFLVFAATDQRSVNQQIAQEAHGLGSLCNVADRPAEGNFHVPAVHRQEGLVVAVSTMAGRPRLAQEVREWIARHLPTFE